LPRAFLGEKKGAAVKKTLQKHGGDKKKFIGGGGVNLERKKAWLGAKEKFQK